MGRRPSIFFTLTSNGPRWAFCSVADTWVAVNTKFVICLEQEA